MRQVWTILAVTFLGAGALTPQSSEKPDSDLEPAEAVGCEGGGDVEIIDRSILTPGNAVVVEGNCDVVIRGSHIIAGEVGVLVSGNGDVSIESSFIQGGRGAVMASGNAEVEYSGSTFRGGVKGEGRAELLPGEGVTSEKIPSPARTLTARDPVVCGKSESLTLSGILIDAPSVALKIADGCDVLLSDSYVKGAEAAIEVAAGGKIRVRNSTLEGASALSVSPGGHAHVAGSNLRGGVKGSVADGGGNAR